MNRLFLLCIVSTSIFLASCSNNDIYTDESENWEINISVFTSGSDIEERLEFIYKNKDTDLSQIDIEFLTIYGSNGRYASDVIEGEKRFNLTRNREDMAKLYDNYMIEVSWTTVAGEELTEVINPVRK